MGDFSCVSFDDPLDDLISGSPREPVAPPAFVQAMAQRDYVEPCNKCGGSGRFTGYSGRSVGKCFACNGVGTSSFKTSPKHRAASRSAAASRRVRAAEGNVEAFKASHPDIFAWMDGNSFSFAVSLLDAVRKYGDLTEKQATAARSCIAKIAVRREAAAQREVDAKPVEMAAIEQAFARAGKALRSPRLTIAGFVISPAKASSRNAGSLYVKGDTGTYLGRVTGGRFVRSGDCDDAIEAKFLAVAADPKAAAISHGRLTGSCACCGRLLTNKKSIELGIGPICAERFGW